jgi:hypothetical protein
VLIPVGGEEGSCEFLLFLEEMLGSKALIGLHVELEEVAQTVGLGG